VQAFHSAPLRLSLLLYTKQRNLSTIEIEKAKRFGRNGKSATLQEGDACFNTAVFRYVI
jgi:hypothetical protein